MRAPRAALALLLLLATATGCEPSGFDSPSLVLGPRVLAVIAEPAETAPGIDVTLSPLVALPNDEAVRLEWSVDLSTRALASAAGQSLGEPGEPIALPSDGARATLSGAETAAALDALLALVDGAPPGTPEHVVGLVYREVGLPVPVRFVMRGEDGEVLLEGLKRVVLTSRAAPSTNPPPPRFSIDGRWVTARAGDPFSCIPEAEAPTVQAGATVVLSPDPNEEWIETFPAFDLEGALFEGTESAYYSWFSTAGDFRFDVTRGPARDGEWTAPEEPGAYPLWLVVRDGHLGAAACRAEVTVVAP